MIRYLTIFEEKNIFKTLLQGFPIFEVRKFVKYTNQKKKQYQNPLAPGYQMPTEMEFSKKNRTQITFFS